MKEQKVEIALPKGRVRVSRDGKAVGWATLTQTEEGIFMDVKVTDKDVTAAGIWSVGWQPR